MTLQRELAPRCRPALKRSLTLPNTAHPLPRRSRFWRHELQGKRDGIGALRSILGPKWRGKCRRNNGLYRAGERLKRDRRGTNLCKVLHIEKFELEASHFK